MNAKLDQLRSRLKELGSLVVAFSGGVDSSFLLSVAQDVLGDGVVAVTAVSAIHPRSEREEAIRFTGERGIEHILIESQETTLPEFLANPPDRCYHCKKSCSGRSRTRNRQGASPTLPMGPIWMTSETTGPVGRPLRRPGSWRPWWRSGFGKEEIRALSRELGLPTWNRPSMACLASRIPYGEPIQEEKLRRVEEAEEVLAELGLIQYRVRHHGVLARIEVEAADLERMMQPEVRLRLLERLKGLGFLHVTLDLEGFVSGSLNRGLKK